MTEFQMLRTYTQHFGAHIHLAKDDERGGVVADGLIISLVAITLAGLAIAFVTNYITSH